MTARQPQRASEAPPGAGLYLTKDELQDLYEGMLLAGAIKRPVVRKLERGLIRCQGDSVTQIEPLHPIPGKLYPVAR